MQLPHWHQKSFIRPTKRGLCCVFFAYLLCILYFPIQIYAECTIFQSFLPFAHVLDIDECALGSHNCGRDFVCTNTPGSFRCQPKDKCEDGFIQDAIGNCIGELGVTPKSKKFCREEGKRSQWLCKNRWKCHNLKIHLSVARKQWTETMTGVEQRKKLTLNF